MRRSSCRYGWDLTRSLLIAFTVAMLAPVVASAAAPQLQTPRAVDRQVARVVSSLMKREHLSRHPLDNEISQRALRLFIKSLDGMKLYFTQADVDEFEKHKDLIDDDFANGDITFAYDVFKRYLVRAEERVALVNQLLAKDFDFTQDEILVADPDKLHFAKTPEESADRWKKRLKYDFLVLNADKLKNDPKAIKERLARRYTSFLKRMQQTDADELLEMFLTSITSSYDPHTNYMSPSQLENFRIQMSLQLEGIGAALQANDGYTEISKLIPGGSAEKSGQLKVEDRIVSVGQGEAGEMVDVVDLNLNDVVKLIRGKAGTIVRLGLIRGGTGGELKTVRIERAKIELKDSEARGVIMEEKKADGTVAKIGVIDLPSFYMDMEGAREGAGDFKSTTRDVRKILEKFNREGVDALVLDLRRNGGGSLTEAISLTGLFIDTGPVVQVKDPDGRTQHYDDLDAGMAWKGPMVVLTSKLSASASEILAGAIQDYKRGLVVGDESTHGKGTVQSLLDLGPQMFRIQNPPNLGALKITMQQFYRPSGDSTQKRGVLADVVLPSLTDHMDISEADLDYPVEFDKINPAQFGKFAGVDAPIVGKLREQSDLRRRESNDFQKLMKNIEKYKEQKKKKEVPLNEAKFAARRAELDSDREDEKLGEELEKRGEEIVKRDFYFNEVLRITLDYVQLLGANKVAFAR